MSEELSLSLEERKDFIDNSGDLMQSVALDGRFRYVNNAWLRILGYRRPQVSKMTIWDIIHPDELEHCQELFRRVMSGEDVGLVTTTFVTKKGQLVYVEGNVNCKVADGKPVYTRAIFRDITKRKKAEEEYENIFNLSPDMVGVFTTEGELVKVNPSWEMILGYKTEELLKMDWTKLVHPDDVERTNKEVAEQLKGSPVVNFINRYKCKDGSYKTLEWQATFAKEGVVYATARDITERKRVGEKLESSEVRLSSIIETANDAIIVSDSSGDIVSWNQAALNIFGYSYDEIIGKPVVTIVPPRFREAHRQGMKRVTATGESHIIGSTVEVAGLKKDGTEVSLELSLASWKVKEGQFFAAIIRDITKRKQAEEEIRKFKTITEKANYGIAMINASTNNIVYTNKTFAHMHGYAGDRLIGCHYSVLFTEEQLKEVEKLKEEVLTETDFGTRELWRKRHDGTVFPTITQSVVVKDEDGKPLFIVATVIDITERKQTEDALKEAEERYRVLFNSGSDAIFVHRLTPDGATGKFIEVNEVACQRLGYSREELLELSVMDIIVTANLEGAPAIITELLADKHILFEAVHLAKDGRGIPVEINARLFEFKEQSIVISIARDITKRKQAEDALRESEERYRAILELSNAVGEAVVMLQDTDDKKAVHTFATEEWSHITGYSMEELLGMSWFELLHPDYHEEALERYQRRLGGEVIPPLFEVSIVRKDGTEVPIQNMTGQTTYRGKFALVIYARDITGPKRAEQEREKLIQELQKTLQEVKTLSGLLPICAWCKKFRDDEGYWKSVEDYLGERTGAEFTHGICPECAAKFFDHS